MEKRRKISEKGEESGALRRPTCRRGKKVVQFFLVLPEEFFSCIFREKDLADQKKMFYNITGKRSGGMNMSPQEIICKHIKDRIRSGEWRPGMHLPPHRELSRQFSVAITTVTRAVGRLKGEGILECRRGQGTTVAEPRPPEVGKDNRRVMLINPLNEKINLTLSQAVNEVFMETEWRVETYCACANLSWYARFLRDCHNKPPAGLLLLPVSPKFFQFTADLMPVPGTKTVIWGLPVPGLKADSISASPFGEGIVLGDYIAARGFRRILYITQGADLGQEEQNTLRGMGQVLRRKGIPFGADNIQNYPDSYSFGPMRDPERGAFEYTLKLIRNSGTLPELIIGGHDGITSGILRALLSAGMKVPEDVSLLSAETGCDRPLVSIPGYAITAFNNMYYLRTRIAAERLLSRLEGNNDPPTHCEVMGRLIEGNTVRKMINNNPITEEIFL